MRNHRYVLLLIISGLAVLGMSFGAGASANPAYPPSTSCTVSTSDHSVSPGDSLTVTGSGFPANTSVALTMQSGQALDTVRTDGQGSFTTHVTIPAGAPEHDRIVAASSSTTCSFNPNATTPITPPQQQSSSPTAITGFAAITASAVALALLAGGVLFVVLGRRRRT